MREPATLRGLLAWARQHLARHQMPLRWYLLDEIPRTSRGKVNRASVAGRCADRTPLDLRAAAGRARSRGHFARAGGDERGRGAASGDPKDELLRFLRGLDLPPSVEITEETSLLRSGLFDSLALFHLTDWIEQRLGAPVDPSAIDLVEEWDTVRADRRISPKTRRRRRGAWPVTADYDIVRYAPEFRDGVLRLQTHLWSPDLAVNDAYFAWKHEQNPFQTAPLVWLALSRGEVVGMRSFFATRWEAGRPPSASRRPVRRRLRDRARAPQSRPRLAHHGDGLRGARARGP